MPFLMKTPPPSARAAALERDFPRRERTTALPGDFLRLEEGAEGGTRQPGTHHRFP
jgi:hypothetical protein